MHTSRRLRQLAASGLSLILLSTGVEAQQTGFTRADTLRGSLGPERSWWDVVFYDLHVKIDPADSTVRGRNGITYRVTGAARAMQIDLQEPLEIDSVVQDGRRLSARRDGNAFFVTVGKQPKGALRTITVYYHGKPRIAEKPPWDGGLIWARDPDGGAWISTACQGLGASVWWPTKDTQADEPDSQRVALTVPDSLQAIGNGRLREIERGRDGWTTWEWFVTSPINNYDVAPYIGHYAQWSDAYEGEGGHLTLDFRPLVQHVEGARRQWQQVQPMLKCFERWFGPYPWYRDGYQLIEAPHLGMEHQSAVAYGNGYQNGYKGYDLSATGWGLTWDFIVIHESAHEWWGNSLTTADVADMWVHEGFANYSESLFTECQYGKAAGAAYVRGTRKLVKNDKPIVGIYGVNAEGSADMYYKGGNMLHTIRQVVDNDSTWRATLRGLQSRFAHQIVTGRQVQEYMSRATGVNLSRVFEQYLTTTDIPVFEYRQDGPALAYRWTNVVRGFDMPIRVGISADSSVRLTPTEAWQTTPLALARSGELQVDEDFFVESRRVERADAPAGASR
ncbi:MAG TPA: M1 family metallopeptidase [Gemmatimonadales bacterium]|nr:M1 family metallopeptidase [Gemmatimonadales bacterium]